MTSGEFTSLPIASITIDRSGRQRRVLDGIEELAASIAATGLINPIVVTRERQLVAGERRLTACTSLGWSDITVQWADTLDPIELHLLELEENIKRVDLSWQDRVEAIAEYHRLLTSRNPEQSTYDTARASGLSQASISQCLTVAEGMKTMPEAKEQDKFSTALNLVKRKQERAKATAVRDLIPDLIPESPVERPTRFASLLNTDFHEWSKTPQQEPFNLLHVDFPYGISTGDKKGQSAAKHLGSYEDGEDIYWELIAALLRNQDNFVAPSAHMLFWFSMRFYEQTRAALADGGWQVSYMPLIWGKSDNSGILPDPNRGPRWNYETAFLCTRGDRKIVRAVPNIFWGPTTKEFHTSEKSYSMLSHFFRMLVDDSTRLLDPTCGSGMAIRAAEDAGAAFSLGLERDAEFFAGARTNLKMWDEA